MKVLAMSREAVNQTQTPTSHPLTSGGILQRQCAGCGQHAIAAEECETCTKKKRGLQRQLTIGSSNDPLEREADRVAAQVMAAPAHPAVGVAPPHIQRSPGSMAQGIGLAPASVDRVLASPGSPLDSALQQDMGDRLNHDFSSVRVHTDTVAALSAHTLNAAAYTVGQHVIFNANRYLPNTSAGRWLIAHELAHVVQQSAWASPYLVRSVDDWLASSINLSTLSYTQLLNEADELTQYLDRQIESSGDTARIQEVLAMLRAEINRREAATTDRAGSSGRGRRRSRGRRSAATTESTTPLPDRYPRILTEMTSVAYTDPAEMRTEYDLIMQWLARSDISQAERAILVAERDSLAPQLRSDRERVASERHAARVRAALTPAAEDEANALRQLASTIEGIVAEPTHPDLFAIYHQGERVAISREQRDRLRTDLTTALQNAARGIDSRVSYYWDRYNSQLAINRDSPVIAAISGWLADVEDPGEELNSRYLWVRGQIRTMQRQIADGQLVAAATLLPDIDRTGQEVRMLARAYYEGLIEGAEMAVQGLEFTRDASFLIAGSIAAVLAAPVVGGFVGAGGLGLTGTSAAVATTAGTGLTVGTGMATVRGTSAATGTALAGGSWDEVSSAFRTEAARGFREGALSGVGAGAARVLGPMLAARLGSELTARVAGEAIVNGATSMVDVLAQGGSLEQAAQAGVRSALLSIPGALVGGVDSPAARYLLGPFTAGATAYMGARADGVSEEQALAAAGTAIASNLAMARATHGTDADAALVERGRAMGASTRETATAARRRTTSLGAAALIGTADALPPVRSGYGGAPVVLAPDGPITPQVGGATDTSSIPVPSSVPETAAVSTPVAESTTTASATTASATAEAPAAVPRRESAGARRTASPSSTARGPIEEAAAMGFIDPALAQPGAEVATATAGTARSVTTSIRAQTAEISAYEARLSQGEIGILAPVGANVTGADYATAVEISPGVYEVVVVDAKSRVSDTSAFGTVRQTLPQAWSDSVDDAIGRLSLGDPVVEQAIRDAWVQGRVRIARDTIDYSVSGQGDLQIDN